MSAFSGQIIIVGTAVCEGFDPRVAKGARCALICVFDCDTLSLMGQMPLYETEVGFNAGAMLDDTLGQNGWGDIKVRACVPVADLADGWEPEVQALITSARKLGVAHMLFEPESERPLRLH
jgi:hypothetical protein